MQTSLVENTIPLSAQVTIKALKQRIRMLENSHNYSRLQYPSHQTLKKQCQLQKIHDFIMDNANCGIFVYSSCGTIVEVNPMAARMLGYRHGEILPISPNNLLQWSRTGSIEQKLTKKDGTYLWVNIHFSHGTVMGSTIHIAIIEDISPHKKQEKAIRAIANFPQESPDPIWRIDAKGVTIYMNPTAQWLSNHTLICAHEHWQTAQREVMNHRKNVDIEIEINNQWFRLMFTYINEAYMNIYGSNITHRVKTEIASQKAYSEIEQKVLERTRQLSHSNKKLRKEIAAKCKTEAKLRELSYIDELTALGNRRHIMERLSHAIEIGKRNNERHALLFIDLDHFREINDYLGHKAGDSLLKQIAGRLTKIARSSDTVARLGGDGFALLLESIHDKSEVTKVAETILAEFQKPFVLKNELHYIHCSLGISLFPDHADRATELFKYADIALYKAKEVRNNYRTYNTATREKTSHISQLHHDIYGALQGHQLQMLYQPKVCLANRSISGAEALVRWNHPKKGVISPSEFIPIAEETGMITSIGKWIIDEACRTLQSWGQQGYDDLHMAINLSPLQFTDKHLFNTAQEAIEKYGLSPNKIEFEITETLAINDFHQTIETTRKFIAMGISIALDDFGTGHSSLSRLREMPINTLKIDRTFIKDLNHSKDDRSFVCMIVNMAKMLNLHIVAEGVENEDHVSFLKALHCDTGQGYLFSKPITSGSFLTLLNNGLTQVWEKQQYSLPIMETTHTN